MTGHPITRDPIADGALGIIGGVAGRRAAPVSWRGRVWPLVLIAAIPMQLGVLLRAYCLDHGWSGQSMYLRACYSDLPVQYAGSGLDGGLTAFFSGEVRLGQPPLSGVVLATLAGLVRDGTIVGEQRTYFLLWALLATILLMIGVWLTAALRPRRPELAAALACSPVVVLTALVGPELLGITLALAALWAWGRRAPIASGVFFGLAISARSMPLLILLALALLAARSGHLRDLRRPVVAAAAAYGVVALIVALGAWHEVTGAYTTWWSSAASYGSIWFIPSLAGHPLPALAATTLAVAGLLLAVAAGFTLAFGATRRPLWSQVALVMIAIVLMTGKNVPVQASLWLVPLVAVSGVRWRDHLIWASGEILYFGAVWLYVGGLANPNRGLPAPWYSVFLLLRLIGIGYLAWRVSRDVLDGPLPRHTAPTDSESADERATPAPEEPIAQLGGMPDARVP